MQTITPLELKKRLEEVKGSKIITVTMNTELKLLKKSRDTKEPCPYVGVRKRTRAKVMVGTDYENGVNNTREREGNERTFEAQKHSWADRTDKPVISTNKAGNQTYANLRVLETYEVEYTADGKAISEEDIAPFKKKQSKPKNQGTEKPIIWNMPFIFPKCSIESYVSDGETVEVKQ